MGFVDKNLRTVHDRQFQRDREQLTDWTADPSDTRLASASTLVRKTGVKPSGSFGIWIILGPNRTSDHHGSLTGTITLIRHLWRVSISFRHSDFR